MIKKKRLTLSLDKEFMQKKNCVHYLFLSVKCKEINKERRRAHAFKQCVR